MKSHDINIFVIPFENIVTLLKEFGIHFDWGEKDRTTAINSWNKYLRLTPKQKRSVAEKMIALIKPELEDRVEKILDNQVSRCLEKYQSKFTLI